MLDHEPELKFVVVLCIALVVIIVVAMIFGKG